MVKIYPFKHHRWSFEKHGRVIMPMNEDLYFREHQSLILAMTNHPDGRDLLCIDRSLPPIIEIAKNHVTCFLDINSKGHLVKLSDFRIGAKWANVIRFRWKEFSKMAKEFYSHPEFGLYRHDISGRFAATVSEFFPDADGDSEPTTMDGSLRYNGGVGGGNDWATLKGFTDGTHAVDDLPTTLICAYRADAAQADDWQYIFRSMFLFNTSILGGGSSISSGTLSLWGRGKDGTLADSTDVNIVDATPASNIAMVLADYSEFGTTLLATTISYANWDGTDTQYNVLTLNGDGLNAISKTGITKLGGIDASHDAAGIAPTWESSGLSSRILSNAAEETGTTKDPKLIVIYTEVGVLAFIPEQIGLNSIGGIF